MAAMSVKLARTTRLRLSLNSKSDGITYNSTQAGVLGELLWVECWGDEALLR